MRRWECSSPTASSPRVPGGPEPAGPPTPTPSTPPHSLRRPPGKALGAQLPAQILRGDQTMPWRVARARTIPRAPVQGRLRGGGTQRLRAGPVPAGTLCVRRRRRGLAAALHLRRLRVLPTASRRLADVRLHVTDCGFYKQCRFYKQCLRFV